MEAALWTSIVLGITLGLANVAAGYLTFRAARTKPHTTFLTIVFGGMVGRMIVVLAMLALAVVVLPINRTGFIFAFFATFALATIAEVILLQRSGMPAATSSTESLPD